MKEALHSIDKIDIMLKEYNEKKTLELYLSAKEYYKPKKKKAIISQKKHTDKKQFKDTYLYIIKAIGTSFYKIGISISPQKRLYALQTANPNKLMIVKKYKFQSKLEATAVEKEMHRHLKKHICLGGTEWFRNEKNIIDQAKNLIEERLCV